VDLTMGQSGAGDAETPGLVWVFEPDGRYAEVPFALDGQTLKAPTVRGSYSDDGEIETLANDYPPNWGTSRHGWRMDGDR
jgi:hypothetical protein